MINPELAYHEIAAKLGVSETSAGVRILRCRERVIAARKETDGSRANRESD
jgi:DNA-directed RNA polymerase specialized sigma24 family protein